MSRRLPPLDRAAREAARDAIAVRLPSFAGCPVYLAETADAVVAAYLVNAPDELFSRAQRQEPA